VNPQGALPQQVLGAHRFQAVSGSHMSPLDLSSLKWGDDGELSPNDTLNLVERSAIAEEMSRGTDQSSLNSNSIPLEEPLQEP